MDYSPQEAAAVTLPLSPMACRILIFLLLQKGEGETGRSFTTLELMSHFGKSRNTVKTAIANLETVGFIQNNGRANGWSLPASHVQRSLLESEAISDPKKVSKFCDISQKSVKILTLSAPSYDVDDLTLNSEREDHQHQERAQSVKILRQYGVSGRVTRRYSHPPCPETAVILAFCWESATMPLNNPGGWINCQLRDGTQPGDDFLELASFWLALGSDGRDNFRSQFDHAMLPVHRISDLVNEFDLSQAAAKLAVELRGLKVFEEAG
jgi:hypothetical protein